MNGAKLLWAVSPGKVIALIAASVALGMLLAVLLIALFEGPELDALEDAEG